MSVMNKHLRRVLKKMIPLGYREEDRDRTAFVVTTPAAPNLRVAVIGRNTPMCIRIFLESHGAVEVWLYDKRDHPVVLRSYRDQGKALVTWDVLSRFLAGLAGKHEELPPFVGIPWADHLMHGVLR